MTCPTTPRPSPAAMGPRRTPTPAKPTRAVKPAPAKAPAPAPEPYVPRTLTPAEAIAPGQLTRHENMRNLLPRAVRKSRMHPEARLVLLTLLAYANFKTGLVHSRHRPDADQLAEDTGLAADRIQVQLHILTQRGWLYTRTLAQGEQSGQLGLFLAIPGLYLEQARADHSAYTAERAEHIARVTDGPGRP